MNQTVSNVTHGPLELQWSVRYVIYVNVVRESRLLVISCDVFRFVLSFYNLRERLPYAPQIVAFMMLPE